MIICLANIKIKINNRFDFIKELCRDYLCEGEPDFTVEVTDDELRIERELSGEEYSDGYIESVCVYRKIGYRLPEFDAFILHSAAIEVDKKAYLVLAKSGVGKTTHICLLKQLLGHKMKVINGDKPIVRFIDSKPVVFGTAWQGKENLGENRCAEISSLLFLKRGDTPEITPISQNEAALLLMRQILIPKDEQTATKALDLADRLLKTVKLYSLSATPEISSAEVSVTVIGE